MKYAQIRSMDISDGPGIRVAFYVQGCTHHCKGCYNSCTWSFDSDDAKDWTTKTNDKIIELMGSDYISGLSLLGGDPICTYERDPDILLDLVKRSKEIYPDKNIWLWTGYTFEEIYNFDDKTPTKLQEKVRPLLDYIDVIVDGPYIESQRFLGQYCGSTNQRVLDVQGCIKNNTVTTYS